MFKRLLILFCLSLPGSAAWMQATKTYSVQQFTTETGLPSNGIKGLAWDQQNGFLWIGTEAGVVRYNGMHFKVYTGEDEQHITNERVAFLIRNNNGTIYSVDNIGNIHFVNKNSLSYRSREKIGGNKNSNIINLWISDRLFQAGHSFENGPFGIQFSRALPLSDTAFFHSQYNRFYYFSFSMKHPREFTLPFEGLGPAFKCDADLFIMDGQRKAWRVNKTDLSFSKTDLVFEDGQPVNVFGALLLWENGMRHPIFIRESKAWRLEYLEGRIVAKLIAEQIPQDVLVRYAQYDESSQTLFLGTDSKGIIIIRKNRVLTVKKERSAPFERTAYYSQVELPDGNVLTNEGAVLGSSPKQTLGFSGRFSANTLLQGDSVLWFYKVLNAEGRNCLHAYNLRTRQLKLFPRIVERFSQSALGISGTHMYVSNEDGIYRFDGDSLKRLYADRSSTPGVLHYAMLETEPGILAIATCNGLLQYDVSANMLDTIYSTGNYCVRSLWRYKDYLFFGTYGGGLYISRNGKVKALPLDKNQYLLYTHCFLDDGRGFCWISTNRGLFKASIADLVNAYEKDAGQVYYHYYGRNDGMDMTEMNGGCTPCGIIKKDNTLSFPTMEGLLWVDPVKAVSSLPTGEIFIDHISADNRKVSLSYLEGDSLSAEQHTIVIGLGLSTWCNKENLYLSYRLNNTGEWIPVNIDNGAFIELNNLTKGKYILQIRKLNGFGPENYSYQEIRFRIPTPWYERTWFYLLAGLLITSMIVLYFRYRTGQLKARQRKLERQVAEKTKELQEQNEVLEKNNSIKTRLISIISHDIVTPLKFVTVAGKNLIEKKEQMPEELQRETLQEITNTSQELQLLSTNILNWIKYQNENRRMMKESFDLHEMVNQIFGILQSLAKQKKSDLVNRVSPGMMVYQFYEPLKILVYNLLTNAIQFTEKGKIEVTGIRVNENITISVADEGVGMSPEQIQRLMAEEVVITSANVDNKRGHGLGYLIIKDLVKTMEARLFIDSRKDEGTTVSVTMPATRYESE